MADTMIKFTIFDSEIDFSSYPGYNTSDGKCIVDFIKEKLKEIKITTALDSFTKIGICFGMGGMCIDDGTSSSGSIDNFNYHYYLNHQNTYGSIAASKNPYSESIDTTDDSLIGFWPAKLSLPSASIDHSFYRIFCKNTLYGSLETSVGLRTIETHAPYYSSNFVNTITSVYNCTDTSHITNTDELAMVKLICRTFMLDRYDVEANEPTFIPLERLNWINDPSNGFYNKLAEAYDMLGTSSTGLDSNWLRIYILLASFYPDDSIGTLPMGTIKSVAIY